MNFSRLLLAARVIPVVFCVAICISPPVVHAESDPALAWRDSHQRFQQAGHLVGAGEFAAADAGRH